MRYLDRQQATSLKTIAFSCSLEFVSILYIRCDCSTSVALVTQDKCFYIFFSTTDPTGSSPPTYKELNIWSDLFVNIFPDFRGEDAA